MQSLALVWASRELIVGPLIWFFHQVLGKHFFTQTWWQAGNKIYKYSILLCQKIIFQSKRANQSNRLKFQSKSNGRGCNSLWKRHGISLSKYSSAGQTNSHFIACAAFLTKQKALKTCALHSTPLHHCQHREIFTNSNTKEQRRAFLSHLHKFMKIYGRCIGCRL